MEKHALRQVKLDRSANPREPERSGFTLIELLVVIAIIAILAALLLPSLTRAKLKAQGVQCMNNHRQLTLAWRQYTDDNQDVLLYASGNQAEWQPGVWMSGNMDYDTGNKSNWDPSVDIYRSPMWSYCGKSLGIFKCPSDTSSVVAGGVAKPRVRTMVMNLYLGGFRGTSLGLFDEKTWRIYRKFSQLGPQGFDRVFVFLDEREDAINWGNFYTEMKGYPVGGRAANPAAYMLSDLPAFYHGNACGFSFADGHSEIKKWRDNRTTPPLKKGLLVFDGINDKPSPNNQDVSWLQDHSTRPTR
jgi:prepilin-type N-terminal cleavage/methylation domain-containing protein/prepilin-type processing-associated H-X9-DG protein